jgi:hypothetical protein
MSNSKEPTIKMSNSKTLEHIVISTDFEPDDALAICCIVVKAVLANKRLFIYIVVGESTVTRYKMSLIDHLFRLLEELYPDTIYQYEMYDGIESNKAYPQPILMDDRHYFTTSDDLKLYSEIFTSNSIDIHYMMKPPREDLKLDNLNCSNTIAIAYGSFNWRTTKATKEQLNNMMSRYKKFYYIDSFTAIGENNSAHLPETLNTKLGNFLRKMCSAWNITIMVDCLETINKCEGKLSDKTLSESEKKSIQEKLNRNEKAYKSIAKCVGTQYLKADILLPLVDLTKMVSAKLVDMSPYPKWEQDPTSNTYVFLDNNQETRNTEVEYFLEYYLSNL